MKFQLTRIDGFPDMNDLLVEFRLRSTVELMLRLPFRAGNEFFRNI